MTRAMELNRDEAEYVVDLIEADATPCRLDIAADLRKQWGMGEQDKNLRAKVDAAYDALERAKRQDVSVR